MPVRPLLLLCLALATGSNAVLRPAITTPASAELKQHSRIQLLALPAPQLDTAAPAGITARLLPIAIGVNMAPPTPLGPQQSLQRLQNVNATLHLRLANEQGRVLWEGQIDTGLSPAWDSDQQLQKACDALLQQLPSSG
jgi:hypothetical protein